MPIGRDYGYYGYTSDDTNIYSVKINKLYGANAILGFLPYDSTKPLMPRGMKMRGINVMDTASKAKRRVPVGSVTSDAWTGVATQVTVPLEGDVDGMAMEIQSAYPEKPKTKVHVIANF